VLVILQPTYVQTRCLENLKMLGGEYDVCERILGELLGENFEMVYFVFCTVPKFIKLCDGAFFIINIALCYIVILILYCISYVCHG